MVVREQEMIAVVANPQLIVCPEPSMGLQHSKSRIGEPIGCPVHEHLATRRSHSFQAAHEVEFAEQPGQGHARPDQTVCVRECDVWTVVARLYRNTAVSCFGCALVSASEDSVHVSIVASGYDKKPPKRRHCLQQPLSDRRLLGVGLRREILEIFIVVVSLADLFRRGRYQQDR